MRKEKTTKTENERDFFLLLLLFDVSVKVLYENSVNFTSQ